MSEVRITSETGGEKGSKPCQLFSAPPAAMRALGEVMGFGAEKYDLWNYRKGIKHSLHINAAYRHVLAHIEGETFDPESGVYHLAHAMANLAMVIQSLEDHGAHFDDRLERDDAQGVIALRQAIERQRPIMFGGHPIPTFPEDAEEYHSL